MLTATHEATSLTELRESSGMKVMDIVERATRYDDEFPESHAGYLGIEENGTRDYWKIHALALVFGVHPDTMARILKPSRKGKKM